MYRLSPFTYLVNGMLATGLANNDIVCSSIEYVTLNPPSGSTCIEYMSEYIAGQGGYLTNNESTSDCHFCIADNTNTYLRQLSSEYSTRWRNFGIMWAFIVFNVFAALFLYWLARVPRKQKVSEEAPMDSVSRTQTSVSRAATKEEKA